MDNELSELLTELRQQGLSFLLLNPAATKAPHADKLVAMVMRIAAHSFMDCDAFWPWLVISENKASGSFRVKAAKKYLSEAKKAIRAGMKGQLSEVDATFLTENHMANVEKLLKPRLSHEQLKMRRVSDQQLFVISMVFLFRSLNGRAPKRGAKDFVLFVSTAACALDVRQGVETDWENPIREALTSAKVVLKQIDNGKIPTNWWIDAVLKRHSPNETQKNDLFKIKVG